MESGVAIDLDSTKQWFDKKKFGKLAVKLLSRAKCFKLVVGTEYSLQDIKRYCAAHNKIVTGTGLMEINCTNFFNYLRIDEYTFEFLRYERKNQRAYYKLLGNKQF